MKVHLAWALSLRTCLGLRSIWALLLVTWTSNLGPPEFASIVALWTRDQNVCEWALSKDIRLRLLLYLIARVDIKQNWWKTKLQHHINETSLFINIRFLYKRTKKKELFWRISICEEDKFWMRIKQIQIRIAVWNQIYMYPYLDIFFLRPVFT